MTRDLETQRPWRQVKTCVHGSGSDLLILECGHERVRNHRSDTPKRARCLSCPPLCVVTDATGSRLVEQRPRKRRKPARPLRFADLRPGAILIHHHKARSVVYPKHPAGLLIANDAEKLVERQLYGVAVVEDRWFDPCAGQDDPIAGEMASVRAITAGGPVGSKWPHTLRGLASNGYHYATPEQAELVRAYLTGREDVVARWRGGELTEEEARLRHPSWSALLRAMGIVSDPPFRS